jgi:putative SOS response-associated peptidase YedK
MLQVHKRLLERNRCVVVVDGFFEWLKEDGNRAGKRPW